MPDDILTPLAAPFDPSVISWRVGATNKEKTKGMALAYIDARDVQDRLDAVMGLNWQVRHPWSSGTKLACEIGLKLGDEWVWRGDGAGDSDVEADKGAFSDSFKRAAVRWGVGRYLYDVQTPWVAIEPFGKSYRIPDSELRRLASFLPRPGGKPKETSSPTIVPVPPQAIEQPFPGDLPTLSDAANDFIRSMRKRISDAPLPSKIDAIVAANKDSLARLKGDSEAAYDDLIAFSSMTKNELLVRAA